MIKRMLESQIRTALADTPVVLINGARQTGKTTLAKAIAGEQKEATYLTLDDPGVLASASHDPVGFVTNRRGLVVIDEVQKVPDLFPAIKLAVDNERRSGRFLLTGSANVLLLPRLSESLAGRMEIITLRTLSQAEIEQGHGNVIDRLLEGQSPAEVIRHGRVDLQERIHRGGYPGAVSRPAARRTNWHASYLSSILQRDIRDLSHIEGLADAPRLLSILAARSGGLLNMADISRDAGMPYTTLLRYLSLLEATFLIHRVPSWFANIGKRLVKAPKLLVGDTGLMAYLLNTEPAIILRDVHYSGRFLETFVGCELLKLVAWSASRPALYHYRTAGGAEVDYVLETGSRRLAGVEVKLSSTIRAEDFSGLKQLARDAQAHFAAGVVFYSGQHILPFGGNLWAAPLECLWC